MPRTGIASAACLSAIAVLWLATALPTPARANDGFFQGAGATLHPIDNHNLRVVSEDLKIIGLDHRTCYELRYSSPTDYYEYKDGKSGEFGPDDFGTIGKRIECPKDSHDRLKEGFWPDWTAEAVYEIEALEDAKDVLFGFPVHTWEVSGQWEFPPSPGVINFHTYVDGQEIHPAQLKWLEGIGAAGQDRALGYTWKASFQKGHRYVLRTTYEFGGDTGGFNEAIGKGETPWFSAHNHEAYGGLAAGMIYYLTPLRQWAPPPPSRISIVVTIPNVPMPSVVPIQSKPVCVGEHSLFYEFKDSLPDEDLKVYYGVAQGSTTLKTVADWKAWLRTMGGSKVEMNCALLNRFRTGAGPALKNILARRKCRPTCAQK